MGKTEKQHTYLIQGFQRIWTSEKLGGSASEGGERSEPRGLAGNRYWRHSDPRVPSPPHRQAPTLPHLPSGRLSGNSHWLLTRALSLSQTSSLTLRTGPQGVCFSLDLERGFTGEPHSKGSESQAPRELLTGTLTVSTLYLPMGSGFLIASPISPLLW